MLLSFNILVLLLLQPALSSPVPLTTASRGCPACKTKSSQQQQQQEEQPSAAELNATAPALGEPCGVYTLSCAPGLRCAPPEDEPRPLRALLEGRGVCSNASSASPSEQPNAAGRCHARPHETHFPVFKLQLNKLRLIVSVFCFWQSHILTVSL